MNLANHDRRQVPLDGRKHAAVAIVVIDSESTDPVSQPGEAAFVLCRRARSLRTHSAQWALPGGRCDPGELVETTALREMHEEVGLELGTDAVLGALDDYPTRSGYVITPVVIWGGVGRELVPNPAEVSRAYRVSLDDLCRSDSPRFETIPEIDQPIVQVPLLGDLIHAPTAALLVQFRWVAIEGRTDDHRVDRFGEPVFAWR